MKTAICACPDQGPLESLVIMLQSAGYTCYMPSNNLLRTVAKTGATKISSLNIDTLVKSWGYERPFSLPVAEADMMNSCDLYVELKDPKSASGLISRWPNLKGKILWYRINGGEPHDTLDLTDCPLLTPNLRYAQNDKWSENAYAMWPPFHRFDEYYAANGRSETYTDPICLVHNLAGWGYGTVKNQMKKLGVRIYGRGSPSGLVNHKQIPGMLSTCLAMVHLKQNDAPGYALYEALAAGCPLIVSQCLIDRMCMEELFEEGVTCLVFEKLIPRHVNSEEIASITKEITGHLERLRDPTENKRIGINGRERLKKLMWDEQKDAKSLKKFLGERFE